MSTDKKKATKTNNPPPMSRLEMSKMMDHVQRIAEQKGLLPEALNDYFMGRHVDDIAEESQGLAETPQQKAQDLMHQTYEASSLKKAISLARKALKLDPLCVDAHLMLGELDAENPIEALSYFEKAKSSGEKKLGETFLKEHKGHFWGLIETRPYMRALHQVMDLYWQLKRQSEAIALAWKMLELNPNDNQGIRYILFDYLLTDNQLTKIPKLLKEYKNDPFAHWQYNKLLFFYKKYGAEDSKTQRQLKAALKSNKHIPKYLTEEAPLPDDEPDTFAIGSEEEAITYVLDSSMPWFCTESAISDLFS